MNWKEKLRSNLLLRNMMSDVIGYPASAAKSTFIPYFQYKIGPYQRDYYLYFTSPPNSIRYKNDIFNKLYEYDGYEIVQYIEFHFSAYDNKEDFLRFLRYETNQRLKLTANKSFKLKLESVLDWLEEKQEEQLTHQQEALETGLGQEVQKIVEREVSKGNTLEQLDFESIAKELISTLTPQIDVLISNAEEKMEAITAAYVTGSIQLNNHNHLEKVIQLFYIIQNISAPKEIAKGEKVFKQFSAIDVAYLLQRFEAFKNKKINTIQGNIKTARDNLNFKNPKVQKLNEALEEFFYA